MPIKFKKYRAIKKVVEPKNLENQDKREIKKFSVVIPKKSDLGKSKRCGQAEKIEKSNHKITARLSDIEYEILEKLKNNVENFNLSDFIKNLILNYNIQTTREILSERFNKNVKDLEILKDTLSKLEKEYKRLNSMRGSTLEQAQELVNSRKSVLYDIDNLKRKIKLVENFIKKYSPYYLDYGAYKRHLLLTKSKY